MDFVLDLSRSTKKDTNPCTFYNDFKACEKGAQQDKRIFNKKKPISIHTRVTLRGFVELRLVEEDFTQSTSYELIRSGSSTHIEFIRNSTATFQKVKPSKVDTKGSVHSNELFFLQANVFSEESDGSKRLTEVHFSEPFLIVSKYDQKDLYKYKRKLKDLKKGRKEDKKIIQKESIKKEQPTIESLSSISSLRRRGRPPKSKNNNNCSYRNCK